MLADRNDAITSIMALNQQEQHLKQCSNYGKEIKKKENIVLARLELTFLINSTVQIN